MRRRWHRTPVRGRGRRPAARSLGRDPRQMGAAGHWSAASGPRMKGSGLRKSRAEPRPPPPAGFASLARAVFASEGSAAPLTSSGRWCWRCPLWSEGTGPGFPAIPWGHPCSHVSLGWGLDQADPPRASALHLLCGEKLPGGLEHTRGQSRLIARRINPLVMLDTVIAAAPSPAPGK